MKRVGGWMDTLLVFACGGRDAKGDEHGHEEEDDKEEDKQGLVRVVETLWVGKGLWV